MISYAFYVSLDKYYPLVGLVQHFANCIAGAVVCVVSAPFLTVMSCRTLTLFEIRNDNLQVTVVTHFERKNR